MDTPLNKLLRKNKSCVSTEKCQTAFEGLKVDVIEERVLKLPDFSKTFEVYTDTSDFSIGGFLMQYCHPNIIWDWMTVHSARKGNDDHYALPMHVDILLTRLQVRGQDRQHGYYLLPVTKKDHPKVS